MSRLAKATIAVLALSAFVTFKVDAAGAKQPQRPNVLFILVDDMGWRDLRCYGHKIHETPNIDALAARGMRFTNAYAACPICAPSRAAIMTGKFPSNTGFVDNFASQLSGRTLLRSRERQFLKLEEVTLAEALKGGGYQTGFLGKWHLSLGMEPRLPTDQGFPPSMSVHHEDWKLIRTFHYGEDGNHDYRLYNLREDIEENRNLAADHPEKVKALDGLIEGYIVAAKVVVPLPNPDFAPAKFDPLTIGVQAGGLKMPPTLGLPGKPIRRRPSTWHRCWDGSPRAVMSRSNQVRFESPPPAVKRFSPMTTCGPAVPLRPDFGFGHAQMGPPDYSGAPKARSSFRRPGRVDHSLPKATWSTFASFRPFRSGPWRSTGLKSDRMMETPKTESDGTSVDQ